MTDAETKLWSHLRSRQVANVKFRRQQPLGTYVADFCSVDPRLVIEIDGGQHVERLTADTERTAHLRALGFSVIRFWNSDVLGNIEGVVTTIEKEIDRLKSLEGK